MSKLFAIYVGGDIAGANLELHDLRFVIADSIEETYDQLRREWWGTPASLHLDCWAELTYADGYRIDLRPEPPTHAQKLYFIHLGGYDGNFGEAHSNLFLVAANAQEAKKRAVEGITQWRDPHRDSLFEIEKFLCLSELTAAHMLHIHVQEDASCAGQPGFTCNYRKIGLKQREA